MSKWRQGALQLHVKVGSSRLNLNTKLEPLWTFFLKKSDLLTLCFQIILFTQNVFNAILLIKFKFNSPSKWNFLWIYIAQLAFQSLTLTCSNTLIRHDQTTGCLWHLDNRKFMATEEHIIGLNLIPRSPLTNLHPVSIPDWMCRK